MPGRDILQRHLEHYAVRALFGPYPAAVGFDRGFRDGEADAAALYRAGTGLVGAVEAVEKPLQVRFIKALAGVAHLYDGPPAAAEGAQAYLAALGRVFHGVVEHVYEQRAVVALVDVRPGGHQGAAPEFHALFRGARGGVQQYGVDGPVLGVLLRVKAVEHAGEVVEPRLQSRAVPALRQEPEGG